MNNTQIDYLLSVTPRPEAATAPVRPRDDAAGFDSLFRQARGTSSQSAPSSPAPSQSAPSPTTQSPPTSSQTGASPPTSSQATESPASPPAAPTQPTKATDDRPPQPTNDLAPPEESSTPSDTAACADDKRDAKDDHEADEVTEATAAAAASAPANGKPVAADAVALADEAITVAIDRKQIVGAQEAGKKGVPTKLRSVPASSNVQAEIASAAVDEGPIDPNTQPAEAAANSAAVQVVEEVVAAPTSDQLQAQAAQSTGDQVAATAAAIEANATDEPKPESRLKPKSNKNTNGNTQPVRTRESGAEQPQRGASATKTAAEVASAVSVNESAAAAADESPADKPDDKPVAPKASTATATENDASPDRSRVTTVSRGTAVNPAVPVAANVDPSQVVAATSPDAPDTDLKPTEIKPAAKEGLPSPFARLERSGPRNSQANRTSGDRAAAPNVDPARFVSRVARAVQTAHERGAPLQLRLSPPELGAMRLEITVQQGALTAKIETDNANARQVLLDNLPALRDRLAEQNVRIERFDVDVRRDGTGEGSDGRANPGPQERGQNRHGEPTSHRPNTVRGTTNQTTSDTPSPIRRTITNTSINLVI